jgi:hypothetical protein
LKDFQTPVELVYETWLEEMRRANNNPNLELNDIYLSKFREDALEIGITRLPIWALKKSAPNSIQQFKLGSYQLKFKKWKSKALELVLKDDRSDIETRPDGTTWVIPGSPTDIGRKKIGPIQNFDEKT